MRSSRSSKDGAAPVAIQLRPARAAQSLVSATEIARTANPIVSNQLPP
jgi:hypothetical protein